MFTKRILIFAAILAALAIILPFFNIRLNLGSPNLGTTPVTLAGIFLPWPFAIIIGIIKGIFAAIATGRFLVEIPAGIGDALMGLLTYFLARRWYTSLAAFVGQLCRFVLSSGLVALCISIFIAMGTITPQAAPVINLTNSFWDNLAKSWLSISYPAMALSIAINSIASIAIIILLDKPINRFLKKENA